MKSLYRDKVTAGDIRPILWNELINIRQYITKGWIKNKAIFWRLKAHFEVISLFKDLLPHDEELQNLYRWCNHSLAGCEMTIDATISDVISGCVTIDDEELVPYPEGII